MLIERFIQLAKTQTDALALQENQLSLSYGALYQRAQAIAVQMQQLGVHPQQRVAIHLPRGMDATCAVLASLLIGACYVPLDIKNPPQRLAFIVDDADVTLMIGDGSIPRGLENRVWLDIHQPIHTPDEPVYASGKPQDLAAILYTSGSTGQPRGVALSHQAIAAFANWAAELISLQAHDRIASTAPLFFDLSTFDLYAVLNTGASLHFVPQVLTLSPSKLSLWLAEQRISGWYSVPSLLVFLVYKGNLAETPLADLRFVLFAGEVFPTPSLIQLAHYWPQTALYNLFGPTETNVCCYWPVQRQQLQAEQPIPIGFAAAGCELRIAENAELQVRGPTLASGYWHQGALQPILNDEGWYATGDRVSQIENQYYFHGRLGRMLKCSGYRVEPAEIEAVVCAVNGVTACAVIGVADAAAGQRPAVVLELTSEGSIAEVRAALSQKLPSYMQPCRYQRVAQLPLLANGKLDYQTLQTLVENPG